MKAPRAGEVVFLHGLESSPAGTKARWFRERYRARTPDLDTREAVAARERARVEGRGIDPGAHDLEEALRRPLELAAASIAEAPAPRLVVGSSFGGALLHELLWRGSYAGPALFLASAGLQVSMRRALPKGTRAILIHGRDDAEIPLEDSRELARTGGPGVQLWEVADEHRLHTILDDGTLEAAVRLLLREPETPA